MCKIIKISLWMSLYKLTGIIQHYDHESVRYPWCYKFHISVDCKILSLFLESLGHSLGHQGGIVFRTKQSQFW